MKRPVIEILVSDGVAQIVRGVNVNGEEWPVTQIAADVATGSLIEVTLSVIPESVTIHVIPKEAT